MDSIWTPDGIRLPYLGGAPLNNNIIILRIYIMYY